MLVILRETLKATLFGMSFFGFFSVVAEDTIAANRVASAVGGGASERTQILVTVPTAGADMGDPNQACRFGPVTGGMGVALSNAGAVSGWVVLSNNTEVPIKVINADKRENTFVITPFNRRSFNWRGNKGVLCFKGIPIGNSQYRYEPVECEKVVSIVKCFPTLDPDQGERFKDLELES